MTTRGRRALLLAVLLAVLGVLFFTQFTIFVVPPLGTAPEGRTLVISRYRNTRFIDSADGICGRAQGGVSLECQGTVIRRVLHDAHIYARLPYSKTLYSISTGGKE